MPIGKSAVTTADKPDPPDACAAWILQFRKFVDHARIIDVILLKMKSRTPYKETLLFSKAKCGAEFHSPTFDESLGLWRARCSRLTLHPTKGTQRKSQHEAFTCLGLTFNPLCHKKMRR